MIGDSYELLFQVKQQGDEALVKIASSLSEIDKVGRTASSTVDNMGAAGGRAAGNINQLKASIDALIAEIRLNTQGLGEMTVAMDRVSSSSAGAAGGIRNVGNAARGAVGDVQAATAALRGLDGSLNMRSAGRFLTDVLGLGPALKAIFPIVGAIAFVGIIDQIIDKAGELYNKWSPVVQAEQNALKVLQDTGREYDSLIKKANQLRLDAYERDHGREARQRLEAGELSGNARYDDAGRISYLQGRIRPLQLQLGIGDYEDAPGRLQGDERQAAEAKLRALEAQLQVAQQQQNVDVAGAKDLNAKADSEDRKKADEERKKALAEINSAEKQASTILRDAQTFELTGLDKIIAKRQELLGVYGRSAKAISDINAAMDLETQRETSSLWNRLGEELEKSDEAFDKSQEKRERDLGRFANRNNAQGAREDRLSEQTGVLGDTADANSVKLQASRALRLANLDGGNGAGAQNIANNTAYQVRIQLAQQLYEIEARRSERVTDEGESEKALAEAKLKYEEELNQAKVDHELRFLELQKQDLEEAHNLAASFYDAIRRGGTGVQRFFSDQGQGIGRALFSNAITETYSSAGRPNIGGIIPGQTDANGQLTTIGRVLQGTPVGTKGKDSATTSNTSALGRLTSAVNRLTGKLGGGSFGSGNAEVLGGSGEAGIEGTSLPSGINGDFGGETSTAAMLDSISDSMSNVSVPGMIGVTYSDLGTMAQTALAATGVGTAAGIAASAGSTYSQFAGALARFAQPGQGPGAIMDAITGDSGDSVAQRAGVITGAGAAAATGILGVVQGVQQGGARGTLSAVAAGAGTIAAFDPDPTSKAVLAGVAAAAGLIKGLLGDPRQSRALYEQRALRDDQYFAPPTITRTTDAAGNEVNYNFMGQTRALPFSTFSEVMPYDKNYTMPFGSGSPNIWGEVPGQIIEPYTNPQNYDTDFSTPNGTNGGRSPGQTIQYITIHANDAQSFADMLNRNSSSVTNVVTKEIRNGHPVGLAIQQAVFGT